MNIKRIRGLTEKIRLITVDPQFPTFVDFAITGTTERIYNVILHFQRQQITCTCMSYRLDRVPCKHVYFVTDKLLKSINPLDGVLVETFLNTQTLSRTDLTSEEEREMYLKHVTGGASMLLTARNDDCAICFDSIKEDGLSLMVCDTCKNGIHESCWRHWSSVSGQNKCVYCKRTQGHLEKDDLGYFVLKT